MLATEALSDLDLMIRSRYGLIHIDTIEEERTTTLLRHLADRMGLPFFIWSRTRGLHRDGNPNGVYDTQDPAQALAHISSSRLPGIYMFPAFDGLSSNELIVHRLKDVADGLSKRSGALVLTGTSLDLHESVRRLTAVMTLPAPGPDEFKQLLERIARDLGQNNVVAIQLTPQDESHLLNALRGLSLLEAEKVLTKAMVEDHRLTADDIVHVIDAKKQIVEREGVLEYYPAEYNLDEIAGLDGLKQWLRKRHAMLNDPERAAEFGLTFPRGVLLIGVPGCGKSLCARAVAAEWGLPLLRLDTGSLYNKFIGETENNFRRAMRTAEQLAPCVLFIDELEKAFASGGTEDGGVSMRVLGTFLSWMQDRKQHVFVVATANDVSRLPPEFLRKGRFDETFFVDLPDAATRTAILRIHLARRKQDPNAFDLDDVTVASEGFSGAEIEQVIVSAMYTAFSESQPLTTQQLLREAAATRPLSQMMAEKIHALREWARDRAVPAN